MGLPHGRKRRGGRAVPRDRAEFASASCRVRGRADKANSDHGARRRTSPRSTSPHTAHSGDEGLFGPRIPKSLGIPFTTAPAALAHKTAGGLRRLALHDAMPRWAHISMTCPGGKCPTGSRPMPRRPGWSIPMTASPGIPFPAREQSPRARRRACSTRVYGKFVVQGRRCAGRAGPGQRQPDRRAWGRTSIPSG